MPLRMCCVTALIEKRDDDPARFCPIAGLEAGLPEEPVAPAPGATP
jgi:hypothetical protein